MDNYEVFVQPSDVWNFYSEHKDKLRSKVAELACDFRSGMQVILSADEAGENPMLSAALNSEPCDWAEITETNAEKEMQILLDDYIIPVELVQKHEDIASVAERREDDLAFSVGSLLDDFTDTMVTDVDEDEMQLLIADIAKLLTHHGFLVYRPTLLYNDVWEYYPYENDDLFVSADEFDDGEKYENSEEDE